MIRCINFRASCFGSTYPSPAATSRASGFLLNSLKGHHHLLPLGCQLSQHRSRAWATRELAVDNAIHRRVCQYRHGFNNPAPLPWTPQSVWKRTDRWSQQSCTCPSLCHQSTLLLGHGSADNQTLLLIKTLVLTPSTATSYSNALAQHLTEASSPVVCEITKFHCSSRCTVLELSAHRISKEHP